MLFVFLACAKLGAVLVPINVRLRDGERQSLIARAQPTLHLGHSFEQVEPKTPITRPAAVGALAALFTSGTTGSPKLIELTHANFEANARATILSLATTSDDSWLGTLPLFHIGGLAMAFRWAAQRARLVLEPTFDAERASAWLESGEVTQASLVPVTLERVLDANAQRGFSTHVRAVLIGGGPMTAALLERARSAGLPVLQTYGLTEACSQVTTERLDDADGTTAGVAIPGVDVRILDGEIQVCGPTVAGEPGRWLATGDLGSLDSKGRLTVLSRRVDLIITGGENVYPAEIEHVLSAHPAVREVVVVPRDDAKWGQAAVALVVWKRAPVPLLEWARARLASFKVPREVRTLESVPRTATGKVERHLLIKQAAEGQFVVTEQARV